MSRRYVVLREESRGRDTVHVLSCPEVKTPEIGVKHVGEVTGRTAQEARDKWIETGSNDSIFGVTDVVIDACAW